jgi:uncharacterized protein (DUF1800 family)
MRTAKLISQKVYSTIFILLLCSQLFGQSQQSASRFTNYGTAAIKTEPRRNLLPPTYSADRVRFQQQATFGYSPALDTYIASFSNGIEGYLDEQLSKSIVPPNYFPDYQDSIHDYSIKPAQPPANCNGTNLIGPPDAPEITPNCFRDTYTMYPLQQWFFKEALYGSAQLRHRVAWALSQVWVTSANELKQSRHMAEYYKILYTYALGDDNVSGTPALADDSYLGLMKAMTLNPAMGEYLDMAYSQKERTIPNTNTVIKPNENYPRELLQLFTTGVNELVVVNPDPTGDPNFNSYGTEKLVNGKPVPVYNQQKINEFARVFTGWTFCNQYISTTECPQARLGSMNFIDPMRFISDNHDTAAKTLLSYPNSVHTSIPAGLAGDVELTRALQNIFNHPNVPPFISKHLIQHLVTSNPSPQYLKRVADKFVNDGTGKRGNMKAVVRAILLDSEARGDSKSDPFGKLREPVQLATNILRAFNVKGVGTAESDGVIFKDANFLKMNQRPFYSPSVFNYYSPKNTITVGSSNLTAPEFALFTPTTAVSRANFAYTLVFSGVPVSLPDITDGTALNWSDIESAYTSAPSEGKAIAAVISALNERLLNNTMPAHMESTIQTAMSGISHSDPAGRIKAAIYLTVTSAEFQVQR